MKAIQFVVLSLFSIGAFAGLFSDDLKLVADKSTIAPGQTVTVTISSKKKYYPQDMLQMYLSTAFSNTPIKQQNVVFNGQGNGLLTWTATLTVPTDLDNTLRKAQICVRKSIKTNFNAITGNDKKGCTSDLLVTGAENSADLSGGKPPVDLKLSYKNKFFAKEPVDVRPGDYIAGMTVRAPSSIPATNFQVFLKNGLSTIPINPAQQKFIRKGTTTNGDGIFEFSFVVPSFGKWNDLEVCVKNARSSLLRDRFSECTNNIYTIKTPRHSHSDSAQIPQDVPQQQFGQAMTPDNQIETGREDNLDPILESEEEDQVYKAKQPKLTTENSSPEFFSDSGSDGADSPIETQNGKDGRTWSDWANGFKPSWGQRSASQVS